MSPELQGLIERELREAGAPNEADRNVIGYGMGAPTVLTHGTEAQQERYLRPLFTCEEIWCQLFSEPGAGSDVAGLATRAVRDGDEWVVNGQKVWTTLAHTARWGMLVARTDPDVPKHQGMTYFIVDMHAPGVEVRPLRQITGDAEFNEVFFTDVRIPDEQRLDAVGVGWRAGHHDVDERAGGHRWRSAGARLGSHPRGPSHLEAEARQDRRPARAPHDLVGGGRGGAAHEHAGPGPAAGRDPGPEGSVAKLKGAELNQRVYELCVDLLGMTGTLFPTRYEMRRPDRAVFSGGADVRRTFLRSRANSIEGGTSEIMRNILGERVLGLPGEPRLDKDMAWSKVPRS